MYPLAILATFWKGMSVCAIAVTLTFTTAMDSTDTSISEWVERTTTDTTLWIHMNIQYALLNIANTSYSRYIHYLVVS